MTTPPPDDRATFDGHAGADNQAQANHSRVNHSQAVTGEIDARAALGGLQQELNRLQRSIRIAIQQQLASMAGQSLGSIAANRELVETIQAMLENHGLRVRCNECGHPAILRVSVRPGCASGVFVFDHTIEGRRTFHGGKTVLPLIQLVSKPPRKKRAPSGKNTRVAS
ncbi:hypothetical protein [Stieleria varia]|uniref:Uncharacterized protein n=1 Tax=Stieleria varia TaxID=2528005 RepID=A0A5C6A0J5_9BACT|nr:hypothetical protein [Stieleria varia]TWT92718.1 hypothetical protein Pla52n_60830 [Stieleria varia]